MVANACVPILLGMRYNLKQPKCIDGLLSEIGLQSTSNHTIKFHVVLVFHMIITGCYWFMDTQTKQHKQNIVAVEKLRKELTVAQEAEQKKKNKK